MKKFLIVLLCGVLLFSFNLVIAQQQSQQGIHEAGTGITDPDTREAGQGTGQGSQDLLNCRFFLRPPIHLPAAQARKR